MKTLNGLKFGFSSVNAGQRATVYEPQLFATSTDGNFRMTAPVSKLLNIQHGEYAMFLNNLQELDQAILAKDPDLVAYCEANGMDINSPEAKIAIHKEFDVWAIAKGIPEFDSKGNAKTTTERLTKSDKLNFVSANFDTMLAAAMDEENGAPAETKDALSRDGITKEEQMEILIDFVQPRELPKYRGSKVANPAGLSGAGVALNFTDSNVWKQLKVDMGDSAKELNRVFDLDIENIQTVTMSDGYKEVTVKALTLGDYSDKKPAKIGSKKDADKEEA